MELVPVRIEREKEEDEEDDEDDEDERIAAEDLEHVPDVADEETVLAVLRSIEIPVNRPEERNNVKSHSKEEIRSVCIGALSRSNVAAKPSQAVRRRPRHVLVEVGGSAEVVDGLHAGRSHCIGTDLHPTRPLRRIR